LNVRGLVVATSSTAHDSLWLPVVNLLACTSAAAGCIRRGRREPHAQVGWYLVALAVVPGSAASWQAGLAGLRGLTRPEFPSTGTWISVLALPVGGVGLLCLPMGPASGPRRIRAALDSLLLGSSLLFIVLATTNSRFIRLNLGKFEFRDVPPFYALF